MGRGIGRKIVVGAMAAGVLVGGVGVAAWASSEIDNGAAATPKSAPARVAVVRPLPSRADHGVLDRKVAGRWVTVAFDRGTVAGAAADHLTLVRPDGHVVTFALTPAIRYTGVPAAGVVANKRATVISNADGTARRVDQKA